MAEQQATINMYEWTGKGWSFYGDCAVNTVENARRILEARRDGVMADIEQFTGDSVTFWCKVTGKRYRHMVEA